MATTTPRNSAATLTLLLLCLSASAAPARVAARKLLVGSEPAPPPLRVKIRGCFTRSLPRGFEAVPAKIVADIAAVDAYAEANNRQRLTYSGTVSVLTAELGSFDMLIVYTFFCDGAAEVFSEAEQAAVQAALATGSLKKLMVWHANNLAGVDNRVPGVAASVGCSNWHVPQLPYIFANPALYASVGPNQPSSNQVMLGVPRASNGLCPASGVQRLNNAMAHAWVSDDASRVTAFSHCYQGGPGAMFYSQTPMDFWLATVCPRLTEFHANAISVFSNDNSCAGPPTCPADVVLSATWLPPNNKMFDVSLTSVPLQDPALPGNVTVSSVEFVDVLKGRRPTFPLAVVSPGSSVVSLRAQRNGAGSGRLYRIKYTAANAAGACGGVAFVCVPHDASAFNPLANASTITNLTAVGLTAPLDTAPKVTCPIPASIEEAQWMPTTAP